MTSWEFIKEKLVALKAEGLYRVPDDGTWREECGRRASNLGVLVIDASSNDYLGYAARPVSRETMQRDPDTGAGASRLIHGTRPIHRALETAISDWLRQPDTLLFTSGYAANVGVLSSLPEEGDLILSDALNHASIIDGCRLSRAEVTVFPHLDADALEAMLAKETPRRRCWVITESYFSMDGDTPDLPRIRQICDRFETPLLLDEAHALGVFGPNGAGLGRQFGIAPDILIGTFGKALGAQGAFVSCPSEIRSWLWNKARSFVYSTATSPALARLIHENVLQVQEDEASRSRLQESVARFRARLAQASLNVPPLSHGPIVPIILGTPERALEAAQQLRDYGILVQAIRPPTVQPGSSRIRVTIKASLGDSDVERLANLVMSICKPLSF